MIQSFFSKVKASLIISPIIRSYNINNEVVKELEGFIRFNAVLINDDNLEIFLYTTVNGELEIKKYSVHWQSNDGELRKRWDNAPHHREIKTFPNHVHIGRKIYPYEDFDIFKIMKLIEKDIFVDF